MFKWILYAILVIAFMFFIMFLCSACTIYTIKMDHPSNIEFDSVDKRMETDSQLAGKRGQLK